MCVWLTGWGIEARVGKGKGARVRGAEGRNCEEASEGACAWCAVWAPCVHVSGSGGVGVGV
eukprot:5138082-Prymnesium_polylepis.2